MGFNILKVDKVQFFQAYFLTKQVVHEYLIQMSALQNLKDEGKSKVNE